ncbi:MAG: radical SAM protein [Zoogloeaceae bacterium]|jgi:wyosine [tRNA(Phe)-imidazoG37] synthetase (radical SAM superfamily)|nr:radical SAM protein [Zoogloeaceae bacterium]
MKEVADCNIERQDMAAARLTIADHRRDQAGLTYVYPVLSRRARGVSIGINLNQNRACNWACVYCQVENLRRGAPEAIDLDRLENELDGFLREAVQGDYLARHVAQARYRKLADIAFSGEGEPTAAREFPAAVERVAAVLRAHALQGRLPLRLITNGSLIHKKETQAGLALLARAGGQVWFKLDRGDAAGMRAVNRIAGDPARVLKNLRACAALLPTWVQTCWFATEGRAPDAAAEAAYLELLAQAAEVICGVHLYGLARASRQGGAEKLSRLSAPVLRAWGRRIQQKTGVRAVKVSP